MAVVNSQAWSKYVPPEWAYEVSKRPTADSSRPARSFDLKLRSVSTDAKGGMSCCFPMSLCSPTCSKDVCHF